MKKHNILKVILLSILVAVICTWIFPTASYQYELVIGERNQLGIFDLAPYISEVLFPYFIYVLLMVLATGIFYGVSYKIPAYRVLLNKIVKAFEKKESIFLTVVMILIAVIVSVSGLSFGMIFVFPFIISIILLMGYNKLVAASVTVGSTMIGILGTTLGYSQTYSYYISGLLGADVYTEMLTKIVLLVIGLVLLIYHVLTYANKTKNGTDKVLEFVPAEIEASSNTKNVTKEKIEVKEVKKETKASNKKSSTVSSKTTSKKSAKASSKTKTAKEAKNSPKKKSSTKTKAYDLKTKVETKVTVKPAKKVYTWPYIIIFDLALIILAISSFDWEGIFEVQWFSNALQVVQDFSIAGFPIFSKLLGNVTAFGQWSLSYEMPLFIVVMACILAFIYGLKFDDFLDSIIDGMKKAMKPAIYMLLVYLVLVICVSGSFQLNITKFLLNLTSGLNVITMTVAAMISSIINVENIYVVSTTVPYVTSVITDSTLYPLLNIIFQSVYGLMMLVAPTSAILIGTLTYLDISYGQWLKHIWKLFLSLLLVLVVVFFILFVV